MDTACANLIQKTFAFHFKLGLYALCVCVMSLVEAACVRSNIPQSSQPVILSDWHHGIMQTYLMPG